MTKIHSGTGVKRMRRLFSI